MGRGLGSIGESEEVLWIADFGLRVEKKAFDKIDVVC